MWLLDSVSLSAIFLELKFLRVKLTTQGLLTFFEIDHSVDRTVGVTSRVFCFQKSEFAISLIFFVKLTSVSIVIVLGVKLFSEF